MAEGEVSSIGVRYHTTIRPPSKTTRPSTIVVFTRPVNVRPCQGEFPDLS